MSYEERNESKKGYQRFRATMHLAMGAFYLVVGVFVIYIKYFGAMELPTGFAYVLGSLMLLYGMFRIWRGVMDLKQIPKRDMQRDFPSLNSKKEE